MAKFHIRIVGGWCGNRMAMICDHLSELMSDRGYVVKLSQQSIWENSAPPVNADLVLQLIPAFSQEELNCPMVHVRHFVKDLDHPETIAKILSAMEEYYPTASSLLAGNNPQSAAAM